MTERELINLKRHFGLWRKGWIAGGGFSGDYTVNCAWRYARDAGKPNGVGWYAYGYLMAREQLRGRVLEAETMAE